MIPHFAETVEPDRDDKSITPATAAERRGYSTPTAREISRITMLNEMKICAMANPLATKRLRLLNLYEH